MKLRRCLIRHRRSGAYFEDGKWTSNPRQATDFFDLREVAEACVRHNLKEVELVFRNGSELGDIVVPLR